MLHRLSRISTSGFACLLLHENTTTTLETSAFVSSKTFEMYLEDLKKPVGEEIGREVLLSLLAACHGMTPTFLSWPRSGILQRQQRWYHGGVRSGQQDCLIVFRPGQRFAEIGYCVRDH